MGHHNVSIYADDSALVIKLASAFRESGSRLHLARGQDELLVPDLLQQLDLLLIDEHMAEIDTWNITTKVREAVGNKRSIAIFGLVERLDSDIILRSRALGVDAFVLKSAIGDPLIQRIRTFARAVPQRSEDSESSAFKSYKTFLVELREKIEILDIDADGGDRRVQADGVSVSLSWKDGRSHATGMKRPAPSTRFRQGQPQGEVATQATMIEGATGGAMPSLIGKTFGKVLIQEEIGRGGGGIVYSGRHTSLDMKVAVKVLYPDLVEADMAFANRFLGEARTAARIRNGNVVRVIDCDRNPETGCYYIVMELIDGNSLEDEIKQLGFVQEFRLTEMAVEVARCLMAAEAVGIVHRDIKPANILITSDGDVRVADLGLAKVVQHTEGIATGQIKGTKTSTSNGKIVGTPYYISPEQIRGEEQIDSRADIYALGATLFHAATGKRPFESDSVREVFYSHLNSPPPQVVTLNPDYSKQFGAIIDRMLQKRTEDRYSSCRELHSAFREHLFWLVRNKKDNRQKGMIKRFRDTINMRP